MSLDHAAFDRDFGDLLGIRREGRHAPTSGERVQPAEEYQICHADAFAWLAERKANSVHAIVTDPPYGVKEFTDEEKAKLRNGRGGMWRIPPAFDGCKRSPLPRFTVLGNVEIVGAQLWSGEPEGE